MESGCRTGTAEGSELSKGSWELITSMERWLTATRGRARPLFRCVRYRGCPGDCFQILDPGREEASNGDVDATIWEESGNAQWGAN